MTHRFKVGVAELVKDRHRVLPCDPRVGGASHGVEGVAEVEQSLGLEVAGAEFSVEFQRLLVTGEGAREFAKVVMGVAEAVPRIGLWATVAILDEKN